MQNLDGTLTAQGQALMAFAAGPTRASTAALLAPSGYAKAFQPTTARAAELRHAPAYHRPHPGQR
jgi:hypothetical protein